MRLIDADKLRKDVIDLPNIYNGFSDTYDKSYILDLVDEQPTIEAEPIRHGHWIYKEYGYPTAIAFYTCSVCGSSRGFDIDNYCPHCGAKMDEEEEQ